MVFSKGVNRRFWLKLLFRLSLVSFELGFNVMFYDFIAVKGRFLEFKNCI